MNPVVQTPWDLHLFFCCVWPVKDYLDTLRPGNGSQPGRKKFSTTGQSSKNFSNHIYLLFMGIYKNSPTCSELKVILGL